MRRALGLILAVFLLCIAVSPILASTIAPPANLGELARISRTVVLAEAGSSQSELRGKIPYTLTTFQVLRHVSGQQAGTRIAVETPGGEVGQVGFAVPGTPRFEKGGRYLLFLDPAPSGNWRLQMMSYGILREDPGTGLMRPVPEAKELDVISREGVEGIAVYREADLLPHLAAAASGAPWHAEAVVATAAQQQAVAGDSLQSTTAAAGAGDGSALASAPASCRFLISNEGSPLRFFGFETGASVSLWHTTPGQVGISDGGVSAVQQATSAWTSNNSSTINFNYAGSKARTASCSGGIADVQGEVTFNDPCSQLAPLQQCTGTIPAGWSSVCCGQVATFGYFYNKTAEPFDDGMWHRLNGESIVINKGAQCLGETDFKEMMTHYVGHGLGFGHHNDQQATMFGQLGVHPSRGATLGATDRLCAEFSYHTFLDVPLSFWAWNFIQSIATSGITRGCGTGDFCPNDPVSRAQISIFLLRGIHGSSYQPPPATGTMFNDVPADFWAGAFIEKLASEGITKGCGNGNFCPNNSLLRDEMAVFLLRAKHGSTYVPPQGTGTRFSDVPPGYWAVDWIEQLAAEGVTNGCGGGNYCPGSPVSRAEMSVFLQRVFSLTLP
ncbi:MAG: S-layer homology domain-containing protein [Acidobacteria bacterium]|nr:S-layer homology domain-containing protein [Acidobacteriota bacterium]